MVTRPFLILALLAGTTLLAPSPSRAAIVAPMSLVELAQAADMVVEGQVTGESSRWQGGTIVTDVTITVAKSLGGDGVAGAGEGGVVVLTTRGGTVDGITQAVPGEASFVVGESVLVFVVAVGDHLEVLGLSQGKLTITAGDAQGEDVVTGSVEHLVGPSGSPLQPLASMPLDEVEALVGAAVASSTTAMGAPDDAVDKQ